jgi:hypothetical protein
VDTALDPADYPVIEPDANERSDTRPHRIRVSFYPHRWFHATAGELADHTAWGTLLEHDTSDETSADTSEPEHTDEAPQDSSTTADETTPADAVPAEATKTTPPAADISATPPTKTAPAKKA